MGRGIESKDAAPLYTEEPAEEYKPYCVVTICRDHGLIGVIPMGPTDMWTMECAARGAVLMETALHGCDGKVESHLRVGLGQSRLAIQDNSPSLEKRRSDSFLTEPYYQA